MVRGEKKMTIDRKSLVGFKDVEKIRRNKKSAAREI
jgi:hypothetical protein